MDTISTLLNYGKTTLNSSSITSISLDSEVLLAHCLNMERLDLLIKKNMTVDTHIANLYRSLIERRKLEEPIAYIIGEKEFWKHIFTVDNSVLIPRADSETLIELLLTLIPNQFNHGKILDLGTGSGCLIASILFELPNFTGLAVDNSDAALNIAKINLQNLKLDNRCNLLKSDWFHSIPLTTYDLIISNPPYIESNYILEKNVHNFEPHSALFAGIDGLDDYRKIAINIKNYMSMESILLLEIGQNQMHLVINIF